MLVWSPLPIQKPHNLPLSKVQGKIGFTRLPESVGGSRRRNWRNEEGDDSPCDTIEAFFDMLYSGLSLLCRVSRRGFFFWLFVICLAPLYLLAWAARLTWHPCILPGFREAHHGPRTGSHIRSEYVKIFFKKEPSLASPLHHKLRVLIHRKKQAACPRRNAGLCFLTRPCLTRSIAWPETWSDI